MCKKNGERRFPLDSVPLTELVARLFLSCVLGGLIGFERQTRRKSAGLRTNILVCIGSCLMMMISVGIEGADRARIASQVVSGIGFLGAGAIMKEGLSVTGLTTAACLWVVAGVGLAVGAGAYTGAVATTIFVMVTLGVPGRFDSFLVQGDNVALALVTKNNPGVLRSLADALAQQNYSIHSIHVHMRDGVQRFGGEPTLEIELEVSARKKLIDRGAVLETLRGIEGVIKVDSLGF